PERAGADRRQIAEDFRRAFLREKTAERRVAAADHDDPADRSVGARRRFDDVEERRWFGFGAANLARREHVKHAGASERVDDGRGHRARLVDACAFRSDLWCQGSYVLTASTSRTRVSHD